jgi:histidinol-phosphate aminotransferase
VGDIGRISAADGLAFPCTDDVIASDYKDDGTNILLDANENAYGPGLSLNEDGHIAATNGDSSATDELHIDLLGLNRYPDP